MKKLLPVILFALLVGILFQPAFVFAENVGGNSEEINILNDKISANKDKIQQLESSIADTKSRIKQKRLESVSLKNQMAIIDNRMLQVGLDIEQTEQKLDVLSLEIEVLELSIEDKEKSMNKQKRMLSELIRTIHYGDGKSYLEIAAAYDSFSDFYNQIQYVESIESDLGDNVRGLRIIREELEEKKVGTEERKKTYEDLRAELEEKKTDLDEQGNYKTNLLYKSQSSELKFQTLLGSLTAQYQQIENEISAIEKEVRSKLNSQDKLETIIGDPSKLSWPTGSRYITAYFHDPDYPYRHVFEHSGVDVRAAQGTPLKATASGYVARAKHCSVASCYSYVMLVHSGGLATVYGHMSKIVVSEDNFITRGSVIGYSGGTPGTVGAGPFVTGPHLHFEVRKNGIPTNPLNYLVKDW